MAFHDVSFLRGTVNRAIANLSLEHQQEEQTASEERELTDLYTNVMSRMRRAGYDEPPSTFGPQVGQVVDALLSVGIRGAVQNRIIDSIIDRMVSLHMATHESTEPGRRFEDLIDTAVTLAIVNELDLPDDRPSIEDEAS